MGMCFGAQDWIRAARDAAVSNYRERIREPLGVIHRELTNTFRQRDSIVTEASRPPALHCTAHLSKGHGTSVPSRSGREGAPLLVPLAAALLQGDLQLSRRSLMRMLEEFEGDFIRRGRELPLEALPAAAAGSSAQARIGQDSTSRAAAQINCLPFCLRRRGLPVSQRRLQAVAAGFVRCRMV